MPRCEENACLSIAYQLPKLVKQLELMNALKIWELKLKYREAAAPFNHAKEIDKIVEPFKD